MCNPGQCHTQYNHPIPTNHLIQTSAGILCHENHQPANSMHQPGQQDHPQYLHPNLLRPQQSMCCCSSCVAINNATKSLEKRKKQVEYIYVYNSKVILLPIPLDIQEFDF